MMKKLSCLGGFILLFCSFGAYAQPPLSSKFFFNDAKVIDLTLATDYKTLSSQRKKNTPQPATVTFRFPDSSVITEDVILQTRGHFRKDQCGMPPIELNFKTPSSPKLQALGKLKLVNGCENNSESGQLILKEELVYKMYNLVTPLSLHIRPLLIHYQDTKGKTKSYTQYGFLLEDVKQMAKRNNCVEVTQQGFSEEGTDRAQMTLVALFQYMIGNTDWSVPAYHNMKLVRPVKDSFALPIAVGYDFDYCGLVNADYAVPPDDLGITSVRERLYRGFTRRIEELEEALDIFRKNKDNIRKLVTDAEGLSQGNKKDVMGYIDEFFRLIEDKGTVKSLFINNAREH